SSDTFRRVLPGVGSTHRFESCRVHSKGGWQRQGVGPLPAQFALPSLAPKEQSELVVDVCQDLKNLICKFLQLSSICVLAKVQAHHTSKLIHVSGALLEQVV